MSSQLTVSQLRVVKVGGSLLGWNQLPMALGRWLDAQSPACNVLIAGGGAVADVIRQADVTYALGEQKSHELCVELLGVTARLLEALLARKSPRTTFSDLQEQRAAKRLPDCCVLDPRDFFLHVESTAPYAVLPHTWDVTSDSIAALVAFSLAADELVLLKSGDCPDKRSPEALAAAGYVDRYFPTAVAPFAGTVRMVNLRSDSQS